VTSRPAGAAATLPVKRPFCAAPVLWVLPALAAAAPQLPERARWGPEGELRWESPDGVRVVGRAGTPNPCGYEAGRAVVEAAWEGNVLVGTVQVCTTGPGCPTGALPYFAIYNGSNGTLVADVLLPEGCASAGLEGRRLVLGPRARLRTDLPRHIALGTQALEERRGRAARTEFEKALALKEDPARAYLGLGESAVLLGENDAAIDAYRKAFQYAPGGLVLYNLACAQARKGDLEEAFQALEDAMKHGFSAADEMAKDPDLAALRTQDAVRFQTLLQRARANAARRPGRSGGRAQP